jgi:peroxiredoxin
VSKSREQQRQEMEAYLDERVVGLEVGEPFPDLVLWSNDGTQAFRITELLPEGGTLFYFSSDCPSCTDAFNALASAIRDLDHRTKPIVIMTGSNSDRLTQSVTNSQIKLPLYRDMEESLHRIHKMILARAYFALDGTGILRAMGTIDTDPAEYQELLMNERAPRQTE